MLKVVKQALKSPFYRKLFKAHKINPRSIKTFEDLEKLPFTTKEAFRDWRQLLAVPYSKVAEIHTSSGTTGFRSYVAYTQKDLEEWGKQVARCLRYANVTKKDRIIIFPSLGLFNGGFGFYYGAKALGASIIPVGFAPFEFQQRIIEEFKPTVIVSVASYLARYAKEHSADSVRVALIGAEPFSEATRKHIERKLGVDVYDIYGLAEVGGVGIGCECKRKGHLHIWKDYYYVEIVEGELVLTTLKREAMPLLRFRTGDLTRWKRCKKGHYVVDRVKGRSDDVIFVKGMKLYMRDIDELMAKIGIQNYLIQVKKDHWNEIFITIGEGEPNKVIDAWQKEFLIKPKVIKKRINKKGKLKKIFELRR